MWYKKKNSQSEKYEAENTLRDVFYDSLNPEATWSLKYARAKIAFCTFLSRIYKWQPRWFSADRTIYLVHTHDLPERLNPQFRRCRGICQTGSIV